MENLKCLGDGLSAEIFLYNTRLKQMIDDALDIRNEKLFMELTELLKAAMEFEAEGAKILKGVEE